ncbi:hypothetical protein [Brucella intermedia]|uniref:hypothetical protein n=1 Tax=Brucella intermedia TaxID=94625 RepID=UPI002362ECB4|nr:hypothetical protein [Brucella intermedia]
MFTTHSDLVREEGLDLLVQIGEMTARIDVKKQKLASLAKQTDAARRLQTMPGIGPMTALAVEISPRRRRVSSQAVTLQRGWALSRGSSRP